ncbi:MAG TPA: ATP-binding protein, partial [Gemmataceae bacterium]
SWSPTLQTTVRTLLVNRFPLLLWWGPQYIQLYNDAYRPIPGAKHPKSMGQPASECWPEIWHIIGPLIDTPFRGGPATWMEDILLEVNRHGFVEETHFTIAYSPVPDEAAPGGIGGVLGTVHEITEKVVGERRMVALRDLGTRPAEAKTAEEACALAAKTLAAHDKDVPFALLYLTDADGTRARLAGATGVPMGQAISPRVVELGTVAAPPWPLVEAMRMGTLQVVADLGCHFSSVPPGPWSDPPNSAVVLPIRSSKAHQIAGFLVAGVSARLRLDNAYRGFLELATTQIATAITNARAYEEERRRAEALAELDRAKTAFFSNVSHEFRTPLTLMLGPIEDMLARSHTDLSPAAKGHLEVVNRNGLRLLRLVNTLLDFSRIEAGRVRAVYQPTDLAAFTADLASVFRSACERAGLRLAVDCPPLSEPVFVDREMWEKIVLNLLSNAFKFTFEGEIAVALRQTGEPEASALGVRAVELRVRDTGAGIPAQEMPHLFERFHRIENARGRTHEGSGIGLALVQELVKLHGGSISAESVLGRGTTFRVLVPLGSAHLPSSQIGKGDPLASAGTMAGPYLEEALRWLPDEVRDDDSRSELPAYPEALPVPYRQAKQAEGDERPRVLVADDNADMRQYLVHLLAERYRVEAVPDGEAALEAARERPPDLILTDVMMPRLDGFGLLRELRADPHTSGLPVILLSARAGEESRVEGMEAGADDYLIKPFSARELLARVGALLQINRLRRESDRAIRQSEERFRVLFETMSEGFVINEVLFDEAGHAYDLRCLEANPAFERHTGLKRSDVLGRTTLELFPDAEPLWFERGGQVAATGVPTHFQAKLGPLEQWFEVRAYRTGPKQIAAVFFNITEQKRAEDALKEADRRKDEFLATLAHELRNPLAPLRNGLQVMKLARNDGNAVEQARAMMERQLGQLVHLVDDLLDVSRISRGKIELRKERVELAKVVQQAVETSRPLLEAGDHDLTVDVPPEPIYVDADVTRLAEVFSNLLNNAAKYTERGGRVTLTIHLASGGCEPPGTVVVVSVRDTGVGIPTPMLPKVFEMFTQVDRSLERSQGGLGIGLSLVKWLVEMHGGSVEARSEGRGMGSEFLVRLPVVLSVVGEQPPDVAEQPRPAACRRILVVDDNRDSAASLAMLLKVMGNETQTAHNGLEALDMATAFRPDVVMLDIGMPGLNGYATAHRIRQEPWGKDAVLVALTGWGQEDDRRRSQEAGFDLHLVKPVEPAALEQLLAEAESPQRRA